MQNMIIFEHKGKEYQLKSEPHEFTMREFIEINEIFDNKKKETVERYIDVIEYLAGKDLADNIKDKDLTVFIEKFHINKKEGEVVESFDLDGKVYKVDFDGKDFVIPAKDMAVMERIIKHEKNWGGMLFAMLYKQEGMNSHDSRNIGHIKKKMGLFMDHLTADLVSPVVVKASVQIVQNVERMRKAIANT